VIVVPISEASVAYARRVRAQLRAAKLHVEVDDSDRKMQKKVREAQLAQFNYILVRRFLSFTSRYAKDCTLKAVGQDFTHIVPADATMRMHKSDCPLGRLSQAGLALCELHPCSACHVIDCSM
jgi:histidyl-tRNA synthetase